MTTSMTFPAPPDRTREPRTTRRLLRGCAVLALVLGSAAPAAAAQTAAPEAGSPASTGLRVASPQDDQPVVRGRAPRAAGPVTGTRRVLAVPVFFTAPDDVTPAALAGRINGSANELYRQSSYGAFGFTARALPWQRVRVPGPPPCDDFPAMRALAAKAALAAGTDPAGFDHVLVYASSKDCAGGGRAELPGRWVVMQGTLFAIPHELGHNLGLGHANALTCRGPGGRIVPLSADCTVDEYEDRYDAMGQEEVTLNAPHRAALGWLDGRTRTVTSSGTYRLAALQRPGSGTAALRIETGTRTYWLEARRPIGRDRSLPEAITDGALLHLGSDEPADTTTRLLDMTPATHPEPGAFPVRDEALLPGRSWTDPEGSVRISIGARGVPWGATPGLPVTVRFLPTWAPPVQQLTATAAPRVTVAWRAHPGSTPDGVAVRKGSRGSGACPETPTDGTAVGDQRWRTSQTDSVTPGAYVCYGVFARYGTRWSPYRWVVNADM